MPTPEQTSPEIITHVPAAAELAGAQVPQIDDAWRAGRDAGAAHQSTPEEIARLRTEALDQPQDDVRSFSEGQRLPKAQIASIVKEIRAEGQNPTPEVATDQPTPTEEGIGTIMLKGTVTTAETDAAAPETQYSDRFKALFAPKNEVVEVAPEAAADAVVKLEDAMVDPNFADIIRTSADGMPFNKVSEVIRSNADLRYKLATFLLDKINIDTVAMLMPKEVAINDPVRPETPGESIDVLAREKVVQLALGYLDSTLDSQAAGKETYDKNTRNGEGALFWAARRLLTERVYPT